MSAYNFFFERTNELEKNLNFDIKQSVKIVKNKKKTINSIKSEIEKVTKNFLNPEGTFEDYIDSAKILNTDTKQNLEAAVLLSESKEKFLRNSENGLLILLNEKNELGKTESLLLMERDELYEKMKNHEFSLECLNNEIDHLIKENYDLKAEVEKTTFHEGLRVIDLKLVKQINSNQILINQQEKLQKKLDSLEKEEKRLNLLLEEEYKNSPVKISLSSLFIEKLSADLKASESETNNLMSQE